MPYKSFVWLCLLPLAVVTLAFFLLPMARLVVTGAQGPQGLVGYLAILAEPRYRATLINTVFLATATTLATLAIATVVGMFLQRFGEQLLAFGTLAGANVPGPDFRLTTVVLRVGGQGFLKALFGL